MVASPSAFTFAVTFTACPLPVTVTPVTVGLLVRGHRHGCRGPGAPLDSVTVTSAVYTVSGVSPVSVTVVVPLETARTGPTVPAPVTW